MRTGIQMKTIILILALSSTAQAKYQTGFYKKSGKQVQGHFKTSPNKTKSDNYSTKGNVNPYNLKKGSKK